VYANLGYFGISASCPRCSFDLYRGTLNPSCDPALVTCPTCKTPYNVLNGRPMEPEKMGGVAGLARTATMGKAGAKADVYAITVDKEGKVYLRER
jgi:nitrite reductase/ring-hydroxylating ferredoxin subunit